QGRGRGRRSARPRGRPAGRSAGASSGRHTTFRRSRRSNPPVKRAGGPLRRTGFLSLAVAAICSVPFAAHARVVERVAAVVGDALVLASEVEDRVGPLMADV